ncbi:MAG: hypothetical protein ACRBF0_14925 [Calditrichia bacterium]
MLRDIVMSFYLILIFVACSCSKNTTPPPPPDVKVDTTSHNFVWQIDTLGPLTTTLNDIVFLTESEALAVGRLSFSDSLGQSFSYGFARWKSSGWTFEQIEDEPGHSLIGARGVWAIDETNIWFAAGSIFHQEGGAYAPLSWQRNLNSLDIAITIWGDSFQNIYSVGAEGLLLFYSNSIWKEPDRLTNIRLTDVGGTPDSEAIWICGRKSTGGASILLKGKEETWSIVWEQGGINSNFYQGELSSLWYCGNDSLIIVGGRQIYWQNVMENSTPRQELFELEAFPNKVRGQAHNDLFIVGQRGMVWHFNGRTWRNYPELQNIDHEFVSVALKDERVIIVGQDYSQGVQRLVIVSGVRNN